MPASAAICSITSTSTGRPEPGRATEVITSCKISPSNSQIWAESEVERVEQRARRQLEQGLRVALRADAQDARRQRAAGQRVAGLGGQGRKRLGQLLGDLLERLDDAQRQGVGALVDDRQRRLAAHGHGHERLGVADALHETGLLGHAALDDHGAPLTQRDGGEADVERVGLRRHREAARGAQPHAIVALDVDRNAAAQLLVHGRADRVEQILGRLGALDARAQGAQDAAPIDGSGSHREERTVNLSCMTMQHFV